jgi:hypothetical protein
MADDFGDEFSFVSSLSIEGLYQHCRLPLLTDSGTHLDANAEAFLRSNVSCPEHRTALLCKMIRANGRYSTIRSVAGTDARVLLVVRNPVDVVNSVMDMFSLFGDEFHESDYDRFVNEVTETYPKEASRFPRDTTVQKQAFYWFFSNYHALRASAGDEHVLAIAYEQYRSQRREMIERILHFVGLKAPPDIFEHGARPIGWVSTEPSITRQEVEELAPYMRAYEETLLPLMGTLGGMRIVATAGAVSLPPKRRLLQEFGKRTTLYLADIAAAREVDTQNLRALSGRLHQTGQELAQAHASLRARESEVRQLAADLKTAQESLASRSAEYALLERRLSEAQTEAEEREAILSGELATLRGEVERLRAAHQRIDDELNRARGMVAYVRSISFYTKPLKKFRAYRRLITDDLGDATED